MARHQQRQYRQSTTVLHIHAGRRHYGGYISVGESARADGTLYFDAPAKFLGDKRKAYNGVFRFDFRHSAADLPDRWFQANDVIIAGTNVTVAYRVFTQFPTTNWTTFEIPLTESVGWIRVGSNRLATAEEMVSALQSIQYLRIRAEWTDTTPTVPTWTT